MGRPPCRWWFLNPIEWLKAIYGAFGVKHPTISLIVVTLLSAMSGAAIWILGANLVAKEDAKMTGEPLPGESRALATSKFLESLLYGMKPNDPLALSLAVMTLLSAALLAGYIPAWKASRIDPMAAVRHE
jgi:ABC-type antimicrobial peptide transport system permease subunit